MDAAAMAAACQNLALEKAVIEPQPTWFLLARSGNLLLRLRNTLHIGEDEAGDLLLAPATGDALVSIEVCDGTLRLSCAQSGYLLYDDDPDSAFAGSQSLELTPGDVVALSLPNNAFTLSGDSTRYSAATRNISLLAEPEIPTLETVVEPALLAEAALVYGQPISVDTAEVEAAVEVEVVAEPAAEADESATETAATEEFEPTAEVFETPILIQEVADRPTPAAPVPERSDPGSTRPGRVILAAAVIALIISLYFVAMQNRSPQGQESAASAAGDIPAGFPEDQTLELLGSSATTVAAERIDAEQPASDNVALNEAEPATAIVESQPPPTIAPTVAIEVTPLSAAAEPAPELQQLVGQQLAQAQQLMDDGILIDPSETSAVRVLIEVLTADPTNEQGLAMIYQCAMLLLDQARAANAAGDEFLARNITEEVLAFHPTLPEALELRSQLWSQ